MREKVFVVFGIGCLSKHTQRRELTSPTPQSVRRELHRIRDLSSAHWAHLQIRGRRVDDDQIARRLGR